MYIFLDEAGDSGFKFDRNSSRYLIIAILLVDDPAGLNRLVEQLRLELGMRPHDELKFNSAKPRARQQFCSMLAETETSIYALVADKPRLIVPHRMTPDGFYREQLRRALEMTAPDLRDARLVIDESVTSRRWQQETAALIRQALNRGPERRLRDVRFKRSRSDVALQAIDMVCGAISAHVEGKRQPVLQDDRSTGYVRLVHPGAGTTDPLSYPGACPGRPPHGDCSLRGS